ncbi:MAG: FAD-dependent oxidoreductase [Bacteriovoracia bacterium]
MSDKKTTIVIGAGPAGLTCAYKLLEEGHCVEVFEASPYVGGLSRSFDLWGQKVDVGPHRFFSSDRIVNEHWQKIVGSDYTLVNRLTRIYYKNRFFYYPLQPFNAFTNLGPIDVARCVASYVKQKFFPLSDPKTFEDWVVNRFGQRLFSIFFKTYSEKVWGISCSRIDADWAAQRIKKLSLYEAIKSAFFKDKSKKHKTLVDQFAYPKNGTGTIYEKMEKSILEWGGTVNKNTPIREVLIDDQGRACGVKLASGEEKKADFVVSTMPLTSMVRGLKGAPHSVKQACDELYFRNTILVYVEVDSDNVFPDNWIYIHSPEVQHGRITNFRNWCPSLYRDAKTSILSLEFWCFEKDELWKKNDEELGKLAIEELEKIQILGSAKPLRTHVLKIPKSYPVYETGYMKPLSLIQDYVNSIPNLIAIGRFGAFKYNNQDHSILMGLLAAKEIMTGKNQNLWSINTDSDYQEQAYVEDVLQPEASPV